MTDISELSESTEPTLQPLIKNLQPLIKNLAITNPYRAILDGWSESRWVKGTARDNEGRVCLIGRMLEVAALDVPNIRSVIDELYPELYDELYLELYLELYTSSLALFNDHPNITFADIQVVLEKSAIKWDEQYG